MFCIDTSRYEQFFQEIQNLSLSLRFVAFTRKYDSDLESRGNPADPTLEYLYLPN